MVVERDLTLGGKSMMQYANYVLQNCTLKTSMVLLSNVTPINSFKKGTKKNK